MKRHIYKFLVLAGFFYTPIAYAQSVPAGVAISLDNLLDISKSIGGFLLVAGGILAAIVSLKPSIGDQRRIEEVLIG